jgi:UDP-GlcNAc:undecaprenyl-phosphate/decaprenyl-phosphate GlcNAc-1-phosphate transferase
VSTRSGALIAGAVAGAGAQLAYHVLHRRPPGGPGLWGRVNHRGEPITLLEGPAYTVGAAVGVALVPGLPASVRTAAVVATTGGGVFGAVDDLRESGTSKGLRGHLGELAHGRLTTGGLKILGIGASALLSALLLRRPARGVDVVIDAGLIAGTANLLNLFDLRPGRAIKVVLLTAPALARGGSASRLVAAAAGAGVAVLPADLAEQAMLGDTGANAAGALLGTAAATGLSRRGRLLMLAGVAGLTLASEKVSFTKVIAQTPGLRELDALGRRPVTS